MKTGSYTYAVLRAKINGLLSGKISKKELGKWSEKAYYYFLSENFLDIESIYTYPFIRQLSTFNTVPDDAAGDFPCTDSRLGEIIDIVNGKSNYFYAYRLYIPWHHKKSESCKPKYKKYEKIKEEILSSEDAINNEGLKKYFLAEARCCRDIITVTDLLEFKIVNIFSEANERATGKLLEMFGSNETRSSENDLVNMLVKYIGCFLGQRGMIVEISFRKGEPNLNIFPE